MTLLMRRHRQVESSGAFDPLAQYLVYDDWNRPDGDLGTAPKGGTWAYINANQYTIASHRVAVTSNQDAYAYLDLGVLDFTAQLDFGLYGGLAIRMQDAGNLISVGYAGSNTLRVYTSVAGAATLVHSYDAGKNGGVVTVDMRGSTLTLSQDGVMVGSHTITGYTSTKIGFTGAVADGDSFGTFWVKP